MTLYTKNNLFDFCCDYENTAAFEKFCQKPPRECEKCLEKYALLDPEYNDNIEGNEITLLSGTCLFLFLEEHIC